MRKAECALAQLEEGAVLTKEEWMHLLSVWPDEAFRAHLAAKARDLAIQYYGRRIFIRGLIEFSNYCQNNCYYCGIRRGNSRVERYRLTEDDILAACRVGYEAGFRTFVLQGGEDPYWTDDRLVPLLQEMRSNYPDVALTLSVGERSLESYRALFEAGANRFLLRHETANAAHYAHLHPPAMSHGHRMQCLADLRSLGYQTGCGIMVGSPGQELSHLAEDFLFMQTFRPHMVGIGPFLPHRDTPFKDKAPGSVPLTLYVLSLVRIMYPNVLLPATTALNTADADGHVLGIRAGCNVIMPNLSPPAVRHKYMLYDGKRYSGQEAAEHVQDLSRRLAAIGYEVCVDRGDHAGFDAPSSL